MLVGYKLNKSNLDSKYDGDGDRADLWEEYNQRKSV